MTAAWIAVGENFSRNEKVQGLIERDQRRYLMLLLMDASGHDIRNEKLACFLLRINPHDLAETISALSDAGLLVDGDLLERMDYKAPKDSRPLSHVWREIRERIFLRDDYTCSYCGSRGERLECDHIHPVSLGGTHEDENLTTACFKCNRSKRAMPLDDWMTKIGGGR